MRKIEIVESCLIIGENRRLRLTPSQIVQLRHESDHFHVNGRCEKDRTGRCRVWNQLRRRARQESRDQFIRGLANAVAAIVVDAHEAVFCEHANEVPGRCPCSSDCYCRSHTCLNR